MKFLAIKDFWKHQHYHSKRGAPWIKLYGAVLTDPAFVQLPEAAQAQLMKLWVLASQLGNPLPNKPRLLAGKIGTLGRFQLTLLIEAGFLVPCDSEADVVRVSREQKASTDASNDDSRQLGESLPLTHADARSRESGEVREERTTQSVNQSAEDRNPAEPVDDGEPALAARLANDSDRIALTAILTRARSPLACCSAIAHMLDGDDPSLGAIDPHRLGRALHDYAANAADWNAAHFRGYLLRTAPRPPKPSRSPPSGSSPRQNGSTSPPPASSPYGDRFKT